MKKGRGLLFVIIGLLCLCLFAGCKNEPEAQVTQPETQVQTEPVGYRILWNLEKARPGEDAPVRKPEADGSYLLSMFENGQKVTVKVPDRSTAGDIDRYYLMGLVFDENGFATQVIPPDRLEEQLLSDEFYVSTAENGVVSINSSYRFDGMEGTFTITEETKIYDMTEVSGEPGTPTVLQENDRILAYGCDGIAREVFVFGREGINSRITRLCEQCGQEASWANWYHEDDLPVASGHYYLVTDVTLAGQKSIPENETICLDLNGHTVTGAENARIYSLHYEGITLSIFDYSQEQTGKLVGWGESSAQGACVWVRYGTFNLYGGTLDGSGAVRKVNGVTVAVPKNAVFNMYGGTIVGGKTTYAIHKDTGAAQNSMGGSVSVAGTFHMYGGTIKNGYATCYQNPNGTYSQGYGGNVLVIGGDFTMHDGTIENGVAEGGGGNVYVTVNGSFTMEGGTISGGQVLNKGKNGGNLVVGANCSFTMTGGTITGGVSRNYGGNIHMLGNMTMSGGQIGEGKVVDLSTGYLKEDHPAKNLFVVNGSFAMSGGWIKGSVSVTDSAKNDGKQPYVCLSGSARIDDAPQGRSNLTLNSGNDGYSMDVKTLTYGAKIGISAEGKFTNPTSWNNAQFFTPDKPSDLCQVGGCLFLGRLRCLCGVQQGGSHFGKCDGTLIPWKSWGSATSLPASDGYYYLMQNVTCSQASVKENAHTRLDLNGKTVTVKAGGRAYTTFNNGSHLTITDSGKNGRIVSSGEAAVQGMGVWVRYGSFTLYGGTIDATAAASTLTGVAVRVDKNTTFTMYGGTVLGGEAKVAEGGKNGSGGSVQVNGTFHMYAGTVAKGRSASHGGNIAIGTSGQFHMYGGTVTGGRNTQKGSSGGNVYITDGGSMYLQGGSVTDGMTQNIGGNIYGAGLLDISAGTVTGGLRYKLAEDGTETTTTFAGGNLQLVGGQLVMSGGLIEGYATVTSYNQNTASVTVSGSARILGGKDGLDLSLSTGGTDAPLPLISIEGTLADDAMIGVTNRGFISQTTTEENADNFCARDGLAVELWNDCLAVGIRYQCDCATQNEKHKPGCDQEEKIWNAWTDEKKLPTQDGYWFLTKPVTSGQNNIAENSHVHLDLHGFTVTGNPGSRIYATFNENSHLTVTDSGTTGALVGSGEATDQGKVVWVRYGSFTLYGGTLDASGVTTGSNGAAVYLPGGTRFIMNGGKIISGTAQLGGGIYSSGNVVINGGSIERGETATASALIHTTGANAALTLNAGTVDGATIAGNGLQTGALTATGGASVTLDGATLMGKPCGMYLYDAITQINSGTVGGAYIYINGNLGKGSSVRISGGKIENGIHLYRGQAQISGAPQISGGFGLKLDSEKVVTFADLTEGAEVLITCADPGRIIAQMEDSTDVQYLRPALQEQQLLYRDGEGLYLSRGKYACQVCGGVYAGCDHETMVEWTPVLEDLSIINGGGNYYLTKDLELTGQLSVKANAKIVLDLNGYSVTRQGRPLAMNNTAELTITDTVGTGRIGSTTNARDNGMVLNINNANANVTMYAGTLDGSGVTNANNGATLNVAGRFTMYGGTVLGGQAVNGGAIRAVGSGVLELYGGSIYGGSASGLGDNLYLASSKSYLLAGGSIAGGVYLSSGTLSVAGNVVVDKTLAAQLNVAQPGYSLQLNVNKTVDASAGLTQGAKICITLSGSNTTVATAVADEAQCSYFCLDDIPCTRQYDPASQTLILLPLEEEV